LKCKSVLNLLPVITLYCLFENLGPCILNAIIKMQRASSGGSIQGQTNFSLLCVVKFYPTRNTWRFSHPPPPGTLSTWSKTFHTQPGCFWVSRVDQNILHISGNNMATKSFFCPFILLDSSYRNGSRT
jgi:hypothetical protein